MALRRAKFGRTPTVQPSLTSTLVSIAREMQNQNDSNIMDAWKNGGTFQGAPATDERVQAYWQKRLSTLDPADPMYDSIKSQIMQLQYGIEQSKMDLAHVQGKISDAAYAQFFIGWARKVPQDSEWWRTLQKDAAQLMESAKAKSAASAQKAKTDAFNNFVAQRQGDMTLGNALTDAIDKISKETGLDITDNGDQLLSLLSKDYAAHPDEYRALQDALHGQSFSGTFTHQFVAMSLDNARQAYKEVATRAHKDGFASQYAGAARGQSNMSDWGQNLAVWPVAKVYDHAYDAFSTVWNDPNASWTDKQAAAAKFSAACTSLAKTKGIDQGTVTMLQADATRAVGGDAGDAPSFGKAMLGHTGFTADMQAGVKFIGEQVALMKANPGQYVYAPTDKNGAFDPTGQGTVGIVATADIPADVVYVAQPGLDGAAHMVAIQPRDIVVKDPNDPNADPVTIGHMLTYQIGGKTVTLYNYPDSTGKSQWSDTSPLADGVGTSTDSKTGNLVVSLPQSADPAAKAAAIDKQYGTDISTQLKTASQVPGAKASSVIYTRDQDGKVTGKLTVSYDGHGFSLTQTGLTLDGEGHQVEGSTVQLPISVNDPKALLAASLAGSRYTGGSIPGVTSDSPAAASIQAASSSLDTAQVTALAQDPTFQHAFLTQTMASFGTDNPLDPRVVAAWSTATAKAAGTDVQSQMRTLVTSAFKPGLSYPGTNEPNVTQTVPTITLGGQSLKLPAVPAYMKNAQGQAPNADLTGAAAFGATILKTGENLLGTGTNFGQTVLNFLNQPKPTAAAVTPTAKPTTVSSTVTTVAGGATSVPTSAPAGVATSAPTPVPAPASSGGAPSNSRVRAV